MESEKQSFFRESQQLVEEYIQERLLLLKFQAAERTSGIVSSLTIGLLIGLLSFLVLFFISALGVFFIAQISGNWYIGFAAIIFLYALLLGIIIIKRKALYRIMTDKIVSLFFVEPSENRSNDAAK